MIQLSLSNFYSCKSNFTYISISNFTKTHGSPSLTLVLSVHSSLWFPYLEQVVACSSSAQEKFSHATELNI